MSVCLIYTKCNPQKGKHLHRGFHVTTTRYIVKACWPITLHIASCLSSHSPVAKRENCLGRGPLWQTSHVAVVLHGLCAVTPFKHHIFLLSGCVQFNCPQWIQSPMDPDLQQKQGSAFLHCVENNCRSVGQLGRRNGHCEWGGPSSQVNFASL